MERGEYGLEGGKGLDVCEDQGDTRGEIKAARGGRERVRVVC